MGFFNKLIVENNFSATKAMTKFTKSGTPLIENICEQCKTKHHFITPSQDNTIKKKGLQVMCEECASELGINRKNSSRQDVKIYKMVSKKL